MKSIIYERPDGGVSIVHPVYGNKNDKETEEEFLDRVRIKDVPIDASNIRIVDRESLPSDRTFRNAWKSNLSVDMVKARGIHKNRLRDIRVPKMQILDVEYLRADERGDLVEKQRIALRKQILRDVTSDPAIEAASTPEQLKTVIPIALKE